MFRRLLVHVESSDASARVVDQAIEIAVRAQAQIRFFHRPTARSRLELDMPAGDVSLSHVETLRIRSETTLRDVIALAMGAGVPCDGLQSDGPNDQAWRAIEDAAAAWKADMIVTADSGATRAGTRERHEEGDRESITVLLVGRPVELIPRLPERPRASLRWVSTQQAALRF